MHRYMYTTLGGSSVEVCPHHLDRRPAHVTESPLCCTGFSIDSEGICCRHIRHSSDALPSGPPPRLTARLSGVFTDSHRPLGGPCVRVVNTTIAPIFTARCKAPDSDVLPAGQPDSPARCPAARTPWSWVWTCTCASCSWRCCPWRASRRGRPARAPGHIAIPFDHPLSAVTIVDPYHRVAALCAPGHVAIPLDHPLSIGRHYYRSVPSCGRPARAPGHVMIIAKTFPIHTHTTSIQADALCSPRAVSLLPSLLSHHQHCPSLLAVVVDCHYSIDHQGEATISPSSRWHSNTGRRYRLSPLTVPIGQPLTLTVDVNRRCLMIDRRLVPCFCRSPKMGVRDGRA
jgi:hypothetical protein